MTGGAELDRIARGGTPSLPSTTASIDARRVAEFSARLYDEHIDEAALLYGQRRTLLDDPEPFAWRSFARLERRLGAHLDALVIGGDVALDACLARVAAADDGELHVAATVSLRRRRWDAVREIVAQADCSMWPTAVTLADAIAAELTDDVVASALDSLTSVTAAPTALMLRVAGLRRIDLGAGLRAALASSDVAKQMAATEAAGLLRDRHSADSLYKLVIRNTNPHVKSAAALALARIGDDRAVGVCLAAAQSESWPMLTLGVIGARSALASLLRAIAAGRASREAILALGLLGDAQAVEPLFVFLDDNPLAPDAALALDLLTGAGLREDVHVPEDVNPDELFDDERALMTNDSTTQEQASAPAAKINRLSQSAESWRSWWRANRPNFASRVRYRRGMAYSPSALLAMLEADTTPRALRQLASEELAIRYGAFVPFSTVMSVAEQERALRHIATWLGQHAAEFHDGAWYFAGRVVTA